MNGRGIPPAVAGASQGLRLWSIWTMVLFLVCEVTSSAARPTFIDDPIYRIDTWEIEDGLPDNSATAMAQTPDGYLWFGTFNGLVRFDGVKFIVFDPKNTPELPSEGIVNLHVDRRGRLWVSTYEGIVVREDGQWRQLKREDGWPGDYARTFSERGNGDVLITTFNGKVVEFSNGRFTEMPPPPGEPAKGYFGCVDEEDRWWVVQHRFIGRWESNRWVKVLSSPELAPDAVGCAQARDGGIWLLLGRELRKLRAGEEQRITLPQSPGSVWGLLEDSRGSVWVASHNRGVSRVNSNGVMTRWSSTNGWADRGRFVFEDREGNLWVGTSGNGLMRFKPRRLHRIAPESGDAVVSSISPDAEGGIWTGTYGNGLFRWNGAKITPVTLSGSAHPSYIQSVLVDQARRVWIGTFGDGLWLLEGHAAQSFSPKQTGGNNIVALFEDSRGRVWVSGGQSISVHDNTSFQGFSESEGLPAGGVVCFAEDRTGMIWVANGKQAFRQTRNGFAEIRPASGHSLEGITCLKADSDGSMWLGSSDGALFRWREERLDAVKSPYGLPLKNVRSIIEDDLNYFWVTSDRHIVRVSRSDLHATADGRKKRPLCQVFDASDLFPGTVFPGNRQPLSARDPQGRLWFATSKGIAMIDPGECQMNSAPPPVHIEEVAYDAPQRRKAPGQDHSAGTAESKQVRLAAPFPNPLVLPPGSSQIEIRYTALSYGAPEKVRFETMLEGTGNNWSNVGGERVARFYARPPGKHVFRVRAVNDHGVWNETGASLAFTVQPFIWQTMSFRFAVGLGLVGAGGGAVWLLSRRRIQHALEREISAQRLRESEERFRNVANTAPVMIWMSGPDRLCNFFNTSWLNFTGRTIEQELGHGWAEGIHPDDRQLCLDTYTRSFDARQSFTMEYRLRRRDGEYRWILDSGLPRLAADGTFLGYIGSAIDISTIKETEVELRTSQERMTAAAEAAHLGMWLWDVPANRIWLSEKCRELFEFPSDGEITYEALLHRIRPEDREVADKAVRRAIADKTRYETEFRLLLPDGALRWIAASGRADYNGQAGPSRMLGICIDISERRRAEEAARDLSGRLINAQEEERRRIARDLHDDLNQRLALLSVEMELFGRAPASDEEPLGKRLEHLATHVKEISSQVHKLSYELHPAKLDQLGLVAAARAFCRETSQRSDVRVDFIPGALPRHLPADVTLCLYRVLQESIQNVVRHSGAKAARAELTMRDSTVHLVVSDSGKGFDMTHARKTAGLGLVSMEERIRLVHGTIAVHSRPGEGTRVELSVPLPQMPEKVTENIKN
ncbi:MAG: PAS domain-containing protein, partial [Verrucomicrobia subdivision 3 bacterium]|nr:PAS domain-containing protein [Limisphaerales bacterium]